MQLEVWLAYVGVLVVFMATPGPSHLLIMSIGLTHGFRRSLATTAGDLSANTLQMALAGLGLAAALMASQRVFLVLKWAGIAWLVWMGIKQIRRALAKGKVASTDSQGVSLVRLWLTGFLTSAANPKAIVFFAALFPQFIEPDSALLPQLLALGASYLMVDGLFLVTYGKLAGAFHQRANGTGQRIMGILSGLGLIGSAIILGVRGASLSQR